MCVSALFRPSIYRVGNFLDCLCVASVPVFTEMVGTIFLRLLECVQFSVYRYIDVYMVKNAGAHCHLIRSYYVRWGCVCGWELPLLNLVLGLVMIELVAYT